MILKTINHPYSYEMKKLCTVFFPNEKIREEGDESIVVITKAENEKLTVKVSVYGKGIEKVYFLKQDEDMAVAMSVLLYTAMSELLGFKPSWGILFGVRPAKLMHRYAEEFGEDGAKSLFVDRFKVFPEKADLAARVMKYENRIIELSKPDSFSLYISIPFCPTRCAYCSFVSHSIERTQKLVEPYVELLCKELERTAGIAEELNLRLETIYVGGGTPTTLSAPQLKTLLDTAANCFDLSTLREYTVEAGRPDTVTSEKLSVLKEHGVSRISINPQTFNDSVLNEIGRRHTSRQTVDAYRLARECGFDNINMDLIAGLPTDTFDSFKHSVDTAVSLGADSITVHSLALKSAAYIVTEDKIFDFADRLTAARMVDYSNEKLTESGYHPYYMYRQSKSVGNLENVGWSREGADCFYNVFMMDETHSVFACGAGGVTRLKEPCGEYIERIYNYKYPYEYIDNFDEVINRKQGIKNFYNFNK